MSQAKELKKKDTTRIDLTADSDEEDYASNLEKECDNASICPICYEYLCSKYSVATHCGHLFCYKCLRNCLKTCSNCPLCRKPLHNTTTFKIHF